MKSLFLPKYEKIIVRISTLTTKGRNPDIILFIFWGNDKIMNSF
jgi:hypothetical protein